MHGTTMIEYLPQTARYILWVLENDSKERCGHHNYVVGQALLNSLTPISAMSENDKDAFDRRLRDRLLDLDVRHDNDGHVTYRARDYYSLDTRSEVNRARN